MKINIIAKESEKAGTTALFFVKKSVQFSAVLSEAGEKQVDSVLESMNDGPFEDLEYLEIDGRPTLFVDAAKERGLSNLDHLRMAAYRLAGRAMKKQINCVSLFLADALREYAGKRRTWKPARHDERAPSVGRAPQRKRLGADWRDGI